MSVTPLNSFHQQSGTRVICFLGHFESELQTGLTGGSSGSKDEVS